MNNSFNTILKKYIDENVNVFTVVGIFNALAIYSSSLKPKGISEILSFLFSALSLIMFLPLLNVPRYSGRSFLSGSFLLIRLFLLCAQIILLYYTVKNYKDYLLVFLHIVGIIEITPIVFKKAQVTLPQKFKKPTGEFLSHIFYILFCLSTLLTSIIILIIDKILTLLLARLNY